MWYLKNIFAEAQGCASKPCPNYALCTEQLNGYICTCACGTGNNFKIGVKFYIDITNYLCDCITLNVVSIGNSVIILCKLFSFIKK